jgi:hypothetical protein
MIAISASEKSDPPSQAEQMTKAEIAQQMFIFPVYPLVAGIVLAGIAETLSHRQFHGHQFDEVTVPSDRS